MGYGKKNNNPIIVDISPEVSLQLSDVVKRTDDLVPQDKLKKGASLYLDGAVTLDQHKANIQQAINGGVNFLMVAIQYRQNVTENVMTKMSTITTLELVLDYCKSIGIETVVRLNLTGIDIGGTKIQPSNITTWFANWKQVCIDTAYVCKYYGVEYLGIANELMYITNNYYTQWQDLIAGVQAVGVKTFFSLNHYEYKDCVIYDLVDAIGVNFWPSITKKGKTETDKNLRKAFFNDLEGVNHIKELNELNTKYNKPVWLTEIGCLPDSNGLIATWDWTPEGVYDEETQALYFKYIFEVVAKTGALSALILFHINKGYTWNYLDKQAEQVVIEHWREV
jgi:hypothetical protein